MSNFICFLTLTVLAVIVAIGIIWYIATTNNKKDTELYIGVITSLIILFIICIIGSINCFNSYITDVRSDAIDHYIVGDVEYQVKLSADGDTLDWKYIVIPVDYD